MNVVVGFAGMTHLGLVSAAGIASRGVDVQCYDEDASVLSLIAAGSLPILEPELDDLFQSHRERFHFSSDARDLARCDLVYISTDVPTDDFGKSDLSGIERLVQRVLPVLKADGLLVILCQVPPGFTRRIGHDRSRLFYQVETLVFGRAVERTLRPERYIVGCASPDTELPPAYKYLLGLFNCPVLPMRYESAELAKISINICLAASISVANTLAELCEAIGADWSEISPSLRLDPRIGPQSYLNPGLGIGGGNIERDLTTVITLSERERTDAGLVRSMIENSRMRKDWPFRVLERELLAQKPGAHIGILGLAYKENTHSTKNSPAFQLLGRLNKGNVRVHDPVVIAETGAERAPDPIEAARGADALAVMTPWKEYKEVNLASLAAVMNGNILLDPFRVFDGKAAKEVGLEYFTLGASAHRMVEAK